MTVTKFNGGGEIIVEPAEARRISKLGVGDLVELKSGVAGDELIATSNVDQLSDGAAVRQ